MGIDSHRGRDVGRGVGRDMGRDIGRDVDGNRKNGEFPSPLPYIGSKWSRTDFDSYFEHKIVKHRFWLLLRTYTALLLPKDSFWAKTNSVVFFSPTGEYKSCRSRKLLKNTPTLAIGSVDTAENEPSKVWPACLPACHPPSVN